MSYYVYCISGNGLDYYGSSGQVYYERISKHTSEYRHYLKYNSGNKSASHKIFESYGENWENCDWDFNILDFYDTEQEALEAENELIKNTNCVNINRALPRTEEEMREYKREWAEKSRRKKGIKKKVVGFDNKTYQRKWKKEFRASLTKDETEAALEKRRITTKIRRDKLSEEEKAEKAKTLTARRNELWTDEYRTQINLKKKEARDARTPEQKQAEKDKRNAQYKASK